MQALAGGIFANSVQQLSHDRAVPVVPQLKGGMVAIAITGEGRYMIRFHSHLCSFVFSRALVAPIETNVSPAKGVCTQVGYGQKRPYSFQNKGFRLSGGCRMAELAAMVHLFLKGKAKTAVLYRLIQMNAEDTTAVAILKPFFSANRVP